MIVRCAVLFVALASLPATALAAHPGQNGKIAYAAQGIWTVNPDGTGATQLTTGSDSEPVWAPDGQRIAFTRAGAVWVMAADGTGAVQITTPSNQATDSSPAWSSDLQRIAFVREPHWTTGAPPDIWITNTDGTDPVQITSTSDREWHLAWSPHGTRIAFDTIDGDGSISAIRPDGSHRETLVSPISLPIFGPANAGWPDWSPDGTRLVFQRSFDCDGDGGYAVATADADGAGEQFIVDEPCNPDPQYYDLPSWSPDGSKVTYAAFGVRTVNADGTGGVLVTGSGVLPDWQPVPAQAAPIGLPRPKGATPFRVPLVPAAQPCGAPNRQHGPPLAFGSCNPPHPGSPHLTIGVGDGSPAFARGEGFLRMDVMPGVPGPPEDTDVGIRFRLTNVMRVSDLSEYTGEVRAKVTVRRTDRIQTLAVSPKSTSMDFPFGFTVHCDPTPGSSLDASTCISFTSLNALLPGAARDGFREIWELDNVTVYDGGPDEDADTEAGNSLFMTQGVFVP